MLFLEYQSICQHWFRGVLSKVIIFYKYSLEQWFSTHGSQSLPNLSSSPKFRHVLTCPVVWDLLKLFISTCTQESKVVTPATIQNKYSLIKGVAFHFLPIFFLLLFFYQLIKQYVCVFWHICVCAMCKRRTCGVQNRVPDALELEVKVVGCKSNKSH